MKPKDRSGGEGRRDGADRPGADGQPDRRSWPGSGRTHRGRSFWLPTSVSTRHWRRRLSIRDELVLAVLPTATVLVVLFLVDVLSRQRVLFTSLASSALLIYLDPEHSATSVRTLVVSQLMAAVLGLVAYLALGGEYLSGGLAMLATIVLMILLDVVHPPALATSLSFAFRSGNERSLVIFALAVGITAILVGLQRAVQWVLVRRRRREAGGRSGNREQPNAHPGDSSGGGDGTEAGGGAERGDRNGPGAGGES